MRRPGSKAAWLFLAGGLFGYLLCLLLLPAEAITGGVVFALLRVRPDRLLARAVVLLWAGPVALMRWVSPFHGPRWWTWVDGWPVLLGTAEDATAAVVTGLTVGPFAAALVWLFAQWRRERSPYRGADDRELRQRTEERRRRWTVQTAQRLHHTDERPWVRRVAGWFAVPLGDSVGPFLGRWQRGDLGRGDSRLWRAEPVFTAAWPDWARRGAARVLGRRVRLPITTGGVHHLVLLGSTGLGKTETVLSVAEWAMRDGWRVVYLSAKQPTGPADSVAPRLVATAAMLGLTSRVLAEGVSPFDPMRGTDRELVDRLVKMEEWRDKYWKAAANEVLSLAVAVRRNLRAPIGDLTDVTDTMGRLKESARATKDRDLIDRADAIHDEAVRGAVTRYRSLAAHLGSWTAPQAAGGWSWEDADLAVAELPTGRQPEAAAALLRAALRDFGAFLRDPSRRPQVDGQAARRVLFICEEAGAVAGDPVIGGDFVELVERGRSAGVFSVVSAQDPLGLGDERVRSAFLSNGAVMSYGQGPQAELVAQLAGTRSVEQGSIQFDNMGIGNGGMTARQREQKMPTQLLRELGVGEAMVAHRGRFATVAAGRAAASYHLPDQTTPDQLSQVTHSVPAISAPTAPAPMSSAPLALPAAPEPVTAGRPGFAPAPGWQPLDGPR